MVKVEDAVLNFIFKLPYGKFVQKTFSYAYEDQRHPLAGGEDKLDLRQPRSIVSCSTKLSLTV